MDAPLSEAGQVKMNINSALNTGLEGVQKGIAGADEAARKIVQSSSVDSPSENATSVVEPIVDLKLYERTVEASSQVVKTADDVLGTLIDTLA